MTTTLAQTTAHTTTEGTSLSPVGSPEGTVATSARDNGQAWQAILSDVDKVRELAQHDMDKATWQGVSDGLLYSHAQASTVLVLTFGMLRRHNVTLFGEGTDRRVVAMAKRLGEAGSPLVTQDKAGRWAFGKSFVSTYAQAGEAILLGVPVDLATASLILRNGQSAAFRKAVDAVRDADDDGRPAAIAAAKASLASARTAANAAKKGKGKAPAAPVTVTQTAVDVATLTERITSDIGELITVADQVTAEQLAAITSRVAELVKAHKG